MGEWWLALAAAGFWLGALVAGLGSRGAGMAAGVTLLASGSASLVLLVVAGAAIRRAWLPLVGAWVLVSFVVLGCGWTGLRAARIRASPLIDLVHRPVRILGGLTSDPEPHPLGWTASVDVGLVSWTVGGAHSLVRIHDAVWLEGRGRPPPLQSGDRIAAEGLVQLLQGDFGDYLRHRGFAATFEADEVTFEGPPRNPLSIGARSVRSTLRRSLGRVFPAREAGLLMGLALGDTSRLEPGIEEDFRATGLSHLTAVSGENLAMFLAPVVAVIGLLNLGRAGRLVIGGTAVGFFVLLTGGEPSVLRAAAMTSIAMIGVFLGRPRSPPSVMGGAVLGLLVLNPTLVYSIGFQLSVAATSGMALLSGPIAERLRWLPAWLALPAGTTMGAQAGVTPLLLYHFRLVPTVTILANLLAFPAVAPAMVLGLAAGGAALVWLPLGALLAAVARMPLRYLEWLSHALARSPLPTVTSSGGSWAVLALGLAGIAGLAWWLRSAHRFKVPRRALVVGALLLPLLAWSNALRAGPPSHLEVRFFDVGQGDAALVRSPGGAAILIDGGPTPEVVVAKLEALGVKRLDAVVATHPHLDHFVGLAAVLARIPVSVVFDSGCRTPESDSPPYREFLRAVRDEGIPERHPMAGEMIVVGDVRLDVLSPDRCWHDTNSDPNNDSIVLLLMYLEDTVLFANEPEGPAQQAMLDSHRPITAMVLNVPHHGAGTSILPFFQAVHERVAIVSVGPNRYGHPVPRTLEWLRSTGALVLRTDEVGDIIVRFQGSGLSISTDHGAPSGP